MAREKTQLRKEIKSASNELQEAKVAYGEAGLEIDAPSRKMLMIYVWTKNAKKREAVADAITRICHEVTGLHHHPEIPQIARDSYEGLIRLGVVNLHRDVEDLEIALIRVKIRLIPFNIRNAGPITAEVISSVKTTYEIPEEWSTCHIYNARLAPQFIYELNTPPNPGFTVENKDGNIVIHRDPNSQKTKLWIDTQLANLIHNLIDTYEPLGPQSKPSTGLVIKFDHEEKADEQKKWTILDGLSTHPIRYEIDIEYLLEPAMNTIPNLACRAVKAMKEAGIPFDLYDVRNFVSRIVTDDSLLVPYYKNLHEFPDKTLPKGEQMRITSRAINNAQEGAIIQVILAIVGDRLSIDVIGEVNRIISSEFEKGVQSVGIEQVLQSTGLYDEVQKLKDEGEDIDVQLVNSLIEGVCHIKLEHVSDPEKFAVMLSSIISNYMELYLRESEEHVDFEAMREDAKTALVDEIVYQYGPALRAYAIPIRIGLRSQAKQYPAVLSIQPENIENTLADPKSIVGAFIDIELNHRMIGPETKIEA